ncbi:MAG: hypothetical protein ABL967_01305 [Bryobacteraceae bacterium]
MIPLPARFSYTTIALFCFGLPLFAQTETTATPPPEPPCKVQGPIENWDAAAQLIAGANATNYAGTFAPDQKAAWDDYAKTATRDWRNLKYRYVDRIAAWRSKHLPKNTSIDTVFYPFSGPDATNPLAFFPEAKDYTLVGLEPVGCVPSNTANYSPEYWPALRKGWQSAVALGFFKTEEMEHDLAEGSAGGVLPVLLFLIARAGNTIVDVTPIAIAPNGNITAPNDAVKTETNGVMIHFRTTQVVNSKTKASANPGPVRTLRYFALNLTNTRLRRKPGTTKYLQTLPAQATLVKSASYLMHKRYFSDIRGTILSKSNVVIEDDSGIPYHYFEPNNWDVHLFGAYDKPIDLFKNWLQDDLKAAYDAKENVQPLDFGISYKFRLGESNLLLAMRKK